MQLLSVVLQQAKLVTNRINNQQAMCRTTRWISMWHSKFCTKYEEGNV